MLLDQPLETKESATLRQALERNEFSDIAQLYETISGLQRYRHSEQSPDIGLDRKIKSLLRYEYDRGLGKRSDNNSSSETLPGFPDRRPEQEILFTSSIAGPLFTSVAQGSIGDHIPTMPGHVHVIKVLPTPANETRILGDLHQDLYVRHSDDTIKAGHGRLVASKRLKYGPYESFSLERDRVNAVLDDKVSAVFLARPEPNSGSMQQSNNEMNGSGDQAEVVRPKTDIDDLTFDEDLLNFFQSTSDLQPDVTSMILQLSDLQNKRLSALSLTSPDAEEEALAQQITTALQDQIVRAEISPKQLLPSGVRSDFTFARLTQSYVGTLPPTIAQAIKATLVQNVAPSALPVSESNDKGTRPEQASRYQVNSPQNAGNNHMTNYGAFPNNKNKTTV